jgi:flagellar biogenesis protein FliO
MSIPLYRHIARPKTALPDVAGLFRSFTRWLALPRRPAGEPSLQLLESVALTAETSIALLRFEQETLVLGVTPQSVTVLARRESPVLPGEARAKTGTALP